ncbi:MAG: LacI family transcriptional regulator [Pelagibacterium sp. SCN 64-44]|nr:MAG: LacI family transcriptional regulator [Pelagibacterium sp. SCN 64-44]
MGRRPTITDLAREAGVSVATVDRVLNGRLKVREDTARRVYDAASAIGYHGAGLIRLRLQGNLPQYKLGFVLQKPKQYFYQSFAEQIQRAVAGNTRINGTATIDFLASPSPGDTVSALLEMGKRSQAVAMVAPDHPNLAEAVASLRAKGVPVFSLLSDFALDARQGYVGLNNLKAGRTAAWFISKTAKRPGKVAIVLGSHRFHGQEVREMGFRTFFREKAPGFHLLETLINLETSQLTYEAILDLIQLHPDLVGLYIAGGGMEGAISALYEEKTAGRVIAVCNEITPESRRALADEIMSLVIATPLDQLCATLVEQMIRAVNTHMQEPASQVFLPFDLHMPESI